jgi:hypothetical protein
MIMADDANRPVMGRPVIEIDWDEFEKLCELQSTLAEIAGWFRCSEDTIESKCKEYYGSTFSEVFAQKRGKGNISLRRAQMQTALDGNAIMQIFLGKNRLGQADKQEIELSTDGLQIILGAKPDSV